MALARALAIEPRVLLLDEPFGALDAKVRKELRRWLRRLHEEMGLTSVFVTHDQEEALELADRVVVMSNGRIEQVGTPDEVYDNPATPFVYEFLGHVNRHALHRRARPGADLAPGVRGRDRARPAPVELLGRGHAYIRPEDIEIVPRAPGEDGTRAKVVHVSTLGPIVRVELQVPGPERAGRGRAAAGTPSRAGPAPRAWRSWSGPAPPGCSPTRPDRRRLDQDSGRNEPMAREGCRIAVIGAGFSGVMTAIHLLWRCEPGERVYLVERSGRIGPGLAYGTAQSAAIWSMSAPRT